MNDLSFWVERFIATDRAFANQAVMPATARRFADMARQRIRLDGGGYRRDHLRAFAQRVEVCKAGGRIVGSKEEGILTLFAASGGKLAVIGVRTLGLK